MFNQPDDRLNDWLASYTVKDADQQLLERILSQVKQPAVLEFTKPSLWQACRMQVAAAAMLGAIGFFLGSSGMSYVPLQTAAAAPIPASSNPNAINIDKIIFVSPTVDEVLL